jgi:hypothetical protein
MTRQRIGHGEPSRPGPLAQAVREAHAPCGSRCISHRCVKQGCRLPLAAGAIAIDCDQCPPFGASGQKKPDFVVLVPDTNPQASPLSCVLLVEMKGTATHPHALVAQLQAGAQVLEHDHRFTGCRNAQRFVPVVLYRDMHVADSTRLRITIRAFTRDWPIVVRRCGTPLRSLCR